DAAQGGRLFAAQCATCHGAAADGNGPAARTLNPRPPALLAPGLTPVMAFRKVSVGVTGTAMPAFGSQLSAADRWNIVAYLATMHARASDVPQGEGLYARDC